MERIYIDRDMAKFERKGETTFDVVFYNGERIENLEPIKLFPISGERQYISLIDSDGKERAVIRNLDTLTENERKIVEECFRAYYMIPKIDKIYEKEEKHGRLRMKVGTDHGVRELHVNSIFNDIKVFYDGRILIRDSDDNRYEITDYEKLDKKSKHILMMYI